MFRNRILSRILSLDSNEENETLKYAIESAYLKIKLSHYDPRTKKELEKNSEKLREISRRFGIWS